MVNNNLSMYSIMVLCYSTTISLDRKLTCIILFVYWYPVPIFLCLWFLWHKWGVAVAFFFLFFFYFLERNSIYVIEKCNCINVVVNFLKSAIVLFLFPDCCSECFFVCLFVFFCTFLTGTFRLLTWCGINWVWFVETDQEICDPNKIWF